MGKKKGKKGRSAKNAMTKCDIESEDLIKAPHSFVINRGKLGKNVTELMMNFRKIMEPFTASDLKVQKKNVVKDFLHMAGPLNVSHLIVFTKSETAIYVRLVKLPRGPTLTYQIKEYSLVKDVISSQKKSLMYEKLFNHHPLLVLNNFSGEGMHFKLMATMFQNMFPSINVNKANLNIIRRCLSLNYNEDKTIDLRQYAIKIVPVGISKAVKKLISNKVPDLSKYQNVEDFLQKSGNLSGSEVELDNATNTVVLPQPVSSRGNITSEKSAIRLYEIGPRLKLQLIKIEEGVMTGEVMFHELITKTPEEIAALKARLKRKKQLKEQRREQQKRNVEKKQQLIEAKKLQQEEKNDEDNDNEVEEDIKLYREEVGEDPDENMLGGSSRKRKLSTSLSKPAKKIKISNNVSKSVKNKSETTNSEGNKKTFQQFLTRRKKRKEAKLIKKKSKQQSQKVLNLRAKHKDNIRLKKKHSKNSKKK